MASDRILIVDDEPDIALILKLHLEEAGMATSWAGDGETALQMLKKKAYAVVLLDIRMPRVDGVEVLKRIRESGNDVEVIMMTAHGNEDLAVECMKAGAVDYFPKPFALDNVIQRVARAISHRRIMQEKLQLEREKTDFVSMLSHDLKNPLTAVIGSVDIVREGRLGPVNQEQSEYLQAALDSCNEVLAMIDNLLDINRFEAGMFRLKIRPYPSADLLLSVTSRFCRMVEYAGIRFSINLAEDLPGIAVDRSVFMRVVGNLLGNAIKFTPQGGEIALCCELLPDGSCRAGFVPQHVPALPETLCNSNMLLRLSVTDTGEGIPEEDLGRIFERFFQSPGSGGRERGGSGLGLAFCKLAVESFGGAIWAESAPDKGSTFVILLPGVDIE